MKEKILNRYEVLHKQLDEGKTPSEIIKSELSCVFPELDERKIDQVACGLIEAGIAYAAKSGKISEISNAANLWQGKLSSMEEEERLASIHSYRLLHDLMTEDNIRLASEGKLEFTEDEISDMLAAMESEEPAYEQVESFLNWVGSSDFLGMEKWYWEQQEVVMENLKNGQITEEILRQFYGAVNTVDERVLYSCAYMIEMADPTLDPESIAPIASLLANASLDSEEVYYELATQQIDVEEAITRLELIWSRVEGVLVEILPVIGATVIFLSFLVLVLTVQGMPAELIFPLGMAVGVIASAVHDNLKDNAEYLLGKVGARIRELSRQKAEIIKDTDQWIAPSVFTEEELTLAELID